MADTAPLINFLSAMMRKGGPRVTHGPQRPNGRPKKPPTIGELPKMATAPQTRNPTRQHLPPLPTIAGPLRR